MLTITGINLTDQVFQEQLSLFGTDIEARDKAEKMELALDEVRKKYGVHTIGFASVMSNDLGIELKDPGGSSNKSTVSEGGRNKKAK